MGKLRCLPHSDHRGARCAPVTLRSLLWRNLRQSPPLRDDASIVPYKSCATFAAHGKAEFLAFTPILYKGKYAFQHAEKKSDLYFPVNRALHFYVMLTKPAKTGELNASCRAAFESNIILLWQQRTIPALRLKHRSGSCGTASALPKCSIMSGCGTRIVLRFAVSATGGAHLCSIQYYLRFWLGICRTSLAVSALRIMRYCLIILL